MTFQEEISDLKARIAKAEHDRDTWRTSGMQEKYLESYSLVEALELQLERMRQQGLEQFSKGEPPPGERERAMAEFSIAYDGRQYQYDRYRYDLLADAVNYARLQRSSLPPRAAAGPMPPPQQVEAPDESQRQLMAELDIRFQDGRFHLGTYRYERLVDAVNYARLQRLNRAGK